jgi:uncharacterized protein YkwD
MAGRERLNPTIVVALCVGIVLPAAAVGGVRFSPPALGPVGGCGPDTVPEATASSHEVSLARTSVLCVVNRERIARGLRPLRVNRRLARVAQAHTRDMVAHRLFSHVGSDGRKVVDRAKRAGYVVRNSTWRVGEAIGWEWYGEASPVRIVPHVLQSPMHYQQVMGNYRDVGIGYVPAPPDSTGKRGATVTIVVGSVKRYRSR